VKEDYLLYLKSIEGLLHQGSVVVADNVKSHAEEVAPISSTSGTPGSIRASTGKLSRISGAALETR